MSVKSEEIPEFPRMIDIELTNTCNMSCVMCPTGNKSSKREKGFIRLELLRKVLDEACEHGSPVRYIRWGEPMIHPQFHDVMIETKVRDIICHINTNGLELDDDWIHFLINVGLDSIKFSFQGVTKERYEKYRNSRGFHKLLKKIKDLHRIRTEMECVHPFIQIGTTITSEPDYMVDQFIAQVDNFTDAVYVGKTRDLQVRAPSSAAYCECPEVFDKLSINFDGSVSACCGDYDNFTLVGNAYDNSLKEIWDGEPLAKFRKMVLEYRHGENYLCSRCARTTT
jgi:MoaA/NifB/PqqE/SkfB family radical SAM enzyme